MELQTTRYVNYATLRHLFKSRYKTDLSAIELMSKLDRKALFPVSFHEYVEDDDTVYVEFVINAQGEYRHMYVPLRVFNGFPIHNPYRP